MPNIDATQSEFERQALETKAAHPDWGDRRIANEIGWDYNKVRRLREHSERIAGKNSTSLATIPPGTDLPALVEIARNALAKAKTVDAALDARDQAELLRKWGQIAQDHQIEADAAEVRIKAERTIGTMLAAEKMRGTITEGRAPAQIVGPDGEPLERVKLPDIGITRKLSMRAQQIAALPAEAYDAAIERVREDILDGKRSSLDITKHAIRGARSLMGSRRESDDSLDFFPTPPWSTRALIERVLIDHLHITPQWFSVWEPACGQGHMSQVLAEYFSSVTATDIADYGCDPRFGGKLDFLAANADAAGEYDWIITNPPFKPGTQFVARALDLATIGVAMFVRLQWLETLDRYETIFRDRPPTLIAFFAERVNLCKGRWDPTGTTATAYIWLVWIKNRPPQAPFWIPPGQREALTRPDDIKRFAPWTLADGKNEAAE